MDITTYSQIFSFTSQILNFLAGHQCHGRGTEQIFSHSPQKGNLDFWRIKAEGDRRREAGPLDWDADLTSEKGEKEGRIE